MLRLLAHAAETIGTENRDLLTTNRGFPEGNGTLSTTYPCAGLGRFSKSSEKFAVFELCGGREGRDLLTKSWSVRQIRW